MSGTKAQSIIAKALKALLSLRTDDSFSLFWAKTLKHSEDLGVNKPMLPCQKKGPLQSCMIVQITITLKKNLLRNIIEQYILRPWIL